jgi:hypothetical protein
MHLKVFLKLKKNPKNPLFWAKKPKKPQKNLKNPLGWGLKKNWVFSNPAPMIYTALYIMFLMHADPLLGQHFFGPQMALA